MAAKKLFTTADVLLFVKPEIGADASQTVPAGTEVEANGEPVERQSRGANQSSFVFQPVKVKGKEGWILAIRLEPAVSKPEEKPVVSKPE